jgi:hypothetical protein
MAETASDGGRGDREPAHTGPDQEPPPPAESAGEIDEVEEASIESFPASDAPAWTEVATGAPAHEPEAPEGEEKQV